VFFERDVNYDANEKVQRDIRINRLSTGIEILSHEFHYFREAAFRWAYTLNEREFSRDLE